jgi:hypothetical protein
VLPLRHLLTLTVHVTLLLCEFALFESVRVSTSIALPRGSGLGEIRPSATTFGERKADLESRFPLLYKNLLPAENIRPPTFMARL